MGKDRIVYNLNVEKEDGLTGFFEKLDAESQKTMKELLSVFPKLQNWIAKEPGRLLEFVNDPVKVMTADLGMKIPVADDALKDISTLLPVWDVNLQRKLKFVFDGFDFASDFIFSFNETVHRDADQLLVKTLRFCMESEENNRAFSSDILETLRGVATRERFSEAAYIRAAEALDGIFIQSFLKAKVAAESIPIAINDRVIGDTGPLEFNLQIHNFRGQL
jgi:hypothetical protein